MSTSASVLRDRIKESCETLEVALSAGKTFSEWSSLTAPHVFIGSTGFLGGRNRGRLPFLEIHIVKQGFQHDVAEGGTLTSTVIVSCHDTGRDPDTVTQRMEAILCACMVAIRDQSADNYTCLGDQSISAPVPGPFGWRMDAEIIVEHSYASDTFEAN